MTIAARVLQGLGAVFALAAVLILAALAARWRDVADDWGAPALIMIAAAFCAGLSWVYFSGASRLLRSETAGIGTALGAVVAGSAPVLLVLFVIGLYQNVVPGARLAADQGTIAAMRAAIAIYYGQHGSYPQHPGNYINPSGGVWHCVNRTYTYSPTTGEVKITSTNTLDDCP